MTIQLSRKDPRRCPFGAAQGAFSLIDVLMAISVLGIMLISLYGGIAFGFAQIQLTREDERATQILSERMEVVRLLSWDQLVNLPGYVPTNFTASYSVANPTNPPPGSLIYSGTVLITNAPVSESYAADMRLVVISLNWQSGREPHRRTVSTFVSRYGLQNYVY